MEKQAKGSTGQNKIEKLAEHLSPLERKIIPFLRENVSAIMEKSGLDKVSVIRAMSFLQQKGILKLEPKSGIMIELGVNGIYYRKNQLPERKLLMFLEENNHISIEEAVKKSKLIENEFRVSLGALKGKALISVSNGKISLQASKEEIAKKSPEERLIEMLPIEHEKLGPEMLYALDKLKNRKEIIEIRKKQESEFSLTEFGEEIAGMEIKSDLIEEVTPEIIAEGAKNRKFRKYDVNAPVPVIYGGKRHFASQSANYAKKIWIEMGFKEMSGQKIVSSFWNFDALFTAQDHPVREMHDTFFIKDAIAKLPEKELVEKVRKAHETGVSGSKGWNYMWKEKTAQRVLLRTHTTCLSAQTLSKLKKDELPAKYFAVGKCFRNETVDWKHGFEFNQTECIVIGPNANLRNLLGYLKELSRKMGFSNVKFQPSFFPYTEPSVEGLVWHEGKKEWVEIFAAGIFRPEVTVPLLGKALPVLAWGPGFDRLMMMAYDISDMRQLYSNDLKMLRNMRFWR